MKITSNHLINDVNVSDKVVIQRLRFQLEQCQTLNSRLEKTVETQKSFIESQKLIIDTQKITIGTQEKTFDFLNDWKFIDHRFKTDLRSTCKN